jgi:hypothetical protein
MAEDKPKAKPAARPKRKPRAKAAAKPAAKTTAKPRAKATAKPRAKAAAKTAPKTAAKAKRKATPKSKPTPRAKSEQPSFSGKLTAIAVGLVLLLLVAEGVLRLTMPHWRDFYSGWFMHQTVVPEHGRVTTGLPGFDGYFAQNNGDFRVHIAINDFGLRNPEPVEAAAGRVWVIGDSMAFGWGVERDETYTGVISTRLNAPTYNIASPGTSVCGYQALLARMPEDLAPRAVIMGLIIENDIHEYDCWKRAKREEAEGIKKPGSGMDVKNFLDFKRFLTRNSALYNFGAVSLKRIGFIRQALSAVGVIREGHVYHRQLDENTLQDSVDLTAAEVDIFRAALPPDTPFAVLLAPSRFEIKNDDPFFTTLRQTMVSGLRARGIAVIDPVSSFKKAGFEPTHFAHDGHWTALGHRIAGDAAAKWLATPLGLSRNSESE